MNTRMIKNLALLFATGVLLLAAGCSTPPFVRAPLSPLGDITPAQLLAQAAQGQPGGIITDDTVVIQAPFRDDMAILSVARIDREKRTLELMGMSHTGIKVFHVAYANDQPVIRFAAGPLEDQTEVLQSLARDSWHIYFDLLPEAEDWVKSDKTTMTFRHKTEQGQTTYVYASHPAVLIEKSFKPGWTTRWRIQYFNDTHLPDVTPGQEQYSLLHPQGIVLDNKKYHYRIIVKNREWKEIAR